MIKKLCSHLFIILSAISFVSPVAFAAEMLNLVEPMQTGKQINPSIENSLNMVQRSQEILSLVDSNVTFSSFTTKDNSFNCESCNRSSQAVKFDSCNSKNNYLINNLDYLGTKGGLLSKLKNNLVAPNNIINPECIRTSMTTIFGSQSKNFKQCTSEGSLKTAATKVRPCVNESYFNLINNSFALASQCLKDYLNSDSEQASEDILAIYSLINIESGFHANAVSATGAGGIGQFTSGAIEDFNHNQLQKIKSFLSNSSNNNCQAINQEILNSKIPMNTSVSNSCERISLKKGNPLLNMIYTFGYFKQTRKILFKGVFENKRYAKNFSRLSNNDQEKLERALTIWAHNAGAAGVAAPMKSLLVGKYFNTPITDVDQFLSDLSKRMSQTPAQANRSIARRKETKEYYPKIKENLQRIQENTRGGTCLN